MNAKTARDALRPRLAALATRPAREQFLVFVAVAAIAGLALDRLLLPPQQARKAALATETARLERERSTLQVPAVVPPAEGPESLERRRQALEARITEAREVFLVPQGGNPLMAAARRAIPESSSVRLGAVRTLPTTLVVRTKAKGQDSEVAIYEHSLELTLHGNYLDLLAYLKRLEPVVAGMLWSSLKLQVAAHPEATMQVILRTLGTEQELPLD